MRRRRKPLDHQSPRSPKKVMVAGSFELAISTGTVGTKT
jgi:hypothetical protein